MKIGIIDDEVDAINGLKASLIRMGQTAPSIFTAQSVQDGCKMLEETSIDLLFLDIQLRDGTGFDLLNMLASIDFEVVFTTAYDQFALKAFEVHALGYLLKPINFEKLVRCVRKVEHQLSESLNNTNDPILEKRIFLKEHGKVHFIQAEQLYYLEAEGSYTKITVTNGKPIITSKNLGYFEKLLPQSRFIRIHRSYIINATYVKELLNYENIVVMENGDQVPISTKEKNHFFTLMGGDKN